mgnify:FL=1
MNYAEITLYMENHKALIYCPDLDTRQEVISVLLDLNPRADTRYLSQTYFPESWPYVGVGGVDAWCLYSAADGYKLLSVDQFRDLVYGADWSIELAPASLEGVL